MSEILGGVGDAALGAALRRFLAELGGSDLLSGHGDAQLGIALRRQLGGAGRQWMPGFQYPGDPPDTIARQMGKVLRSWWGELEESPGERAALRRADALDEVAAVPAFHRLRWSIDKVLDGRGLSSSQRERLLVAAALAARLRDDVQREHGFVGQMAGYGSDAAPVSSLRFRRLLQATETSDLFRQLRRILAILDHRCDLLSLADGVLNWGESRRKRWAYAYYGLAPGKD